MGEKHYRHLLILIRKALFFNWVCALIYVNNLSIDI